MATLGIESGASTLAIQRNPEVSPVSRLADHQSAPPAGTAGLPLPPPQQPVTLTPPALTQPALLPPAVRSGSAVVPLAPARPLVGAGAPLIGAPGSAPQGAGSVTPSSPPGPGAGGPGAERAATPVAALQRSSARAPAGAAPDTLRRLVPTLTPTAPAAAGGAPVQRDAGAAAGGSPASALAPGALAVGPSAGAPPGAAPSGSTWHQTDPLPLHTPAASVPSAADIAVEAGLAERQPDGTLLYTTPPGGRPQETTIVQRAPQVDSAPPSLSPAGALPGASRLSVGSIGAAGAAGGAGAAGAAGASSAERSPDELDRLARKLYQRLRSELHADLRNQLEARNRAGRFRP